jgi:signal peptidase II
MRWWQLVTVVLLVGGLVGCDHATKHLAATRWRAAPAVVVPGFVALTYTENRDTAFSLLHPVLPEKVRRPLLLGLASLGSLLALGLLVGRWRRSSYSEKLATGIFLAGAVGNVADRAWRGYVIDFVSIGPWPVFNVADVALCVAVALLALAWRAERPAAVAPAGGEPPSAPTPSS